MFDVRFDPATGKATSTDLTFDLGDQPVPDVALDAATGDIYAATDFGVARRLAKGSGPWITGADDQPKTAVYGLTLAPGRKPGDRLLYAATHGRGAWRTEFPDVKRRRTARRLIPNSGAFGDGPDQAGRTAQAQDIAVPTFQPEPGEMRRVWATSRACPSWGINRLGPAAGDATSPDTTRRQVDNPISRGYNVRAGAVALLRFVPSRGFVNSQGGT